MATHTSELGVYENVAGGTGCGSVTASFFQLGTWGPVVVMDGTVSILSGVAPPGILPFVCGVGTGTTVLYMVGTPTTLGVYTYTARAHLSDGGNFDVACVQTVAVSPPTLTSVTPNHGPKAGGTHVTLAGTFLSSATGVTLGGATAPDVAVTSAIAVTGLTPAHVVGAVDVTITTVGGSATLASGYTYTSVDSVTPDSGDVAGGTVVTISGFGFEFATDVTFGGVAATIWALIDTTTVTATTPLHAAGVVTVTVEGVGSLVNAYTYTYTITAEVTGIAPVNLLPPIPVQSDLVSASKVSTDWTRWLTVVKQRIERLLPASGFTASVEFTGSPTVPVASVLLQGRRLVGRTTEDYGAAEEIQVTAGLTLANGLLSLTGLQSGYVVGDVLYAESATALARLADVAIGSYLRSGGVAAAPLWSTLTLPNAATSGDILKASGANAYASAAPEALTKADDTNVTLTLTGTPLTALVNAVTVTAGWTGTLAVARGGIGVGTLAANGVLYGNGTSAVQALAVNATATQKFLTQTSGAAPAWDTIADEYYEPLTNGDQTLPELIFDSFGDVIMVLN